MKSKEGPKGDHTNKLKNTSRLSESVLLEGENNGVKGLLSCCRT